VIFTLVHLTCIQIGFGLVSYKTGCLPGAEVPLGSLVNYNLKYV
jgi:hypothetical protein